MLDTNIELFASNLYYIGGISSIVCNLMLLYLVISASPKSMRDYRLIIGNSAVGYLMSSMLIVIVQPRQIIRGQLIAYLPIGIIRHSPYSNTIARFCFALNFTAMQYISFSFPVAFFYRYLMLCGDSTMLKKYLSRNKLIAIFICLFIFCLVEAGSYNFFCLPPDRILQLLLAANSTSTINDITNRPLFGHHIGERPAVLIVILITVLMPIPAVVVAFELSRATVRRLVKRRRLLSPSTYRAHMRLIRALTITSALLLTFVAVPIFNYAITVCRPISTSIQEYLCYAPISMLYAGDALVTIYLIQPYRATIIKWIDTVNRQLLTICNR